MTTALVVGTASATVLLVASGERPARFVLKPLASLGFVLVGLSVGITETTFGVWILVGLAFGAVGDVALLGSSDRAFLVGLGAFLVGHLAYSAGLVGETGSLLPGGVAIGALLAGGSWAWMRSHLPSDLRIPVAVYTVVIAIMVALAVGATSVRPMATIGALLFAASDLTVARDRFVAPMRWNAVVGLPLYYAGQILIALSTR